MIQEAYVSFEVAKLLKEKGFNCPCRVVYSPKGIIKHYLKEEVYGHNLKGHKKLCPTLQMAMKWLREEYGIFIEISALNSYRWVYTIYRLFEERVVEVWNDGTYASYEDVTDDALKYCLENLNKFI